MLYRRSFLLRHRRLVGLVRGDELAPRHLARLVARQAERLRSQSVFSCTGRSS
jgi:hypothetical protein